MRRRHFLCAAASLAAIAPAAALAGGQPRAGFPRDLAGIPRAGFERRASGLVVATYRDGDFVAQVQEAPGTVAVPDGGDTPAMRGTLHQLYDVEVNDVRRQDAELEVLREGAYTGGQAGRTWTWQLGIYGVRPRSGGPEGTRLLLVTGHANRVVFVQARWRAGGGALLPFIDALSAVLAATRGPLDDGR